MPVFDVNKLVYLDGGMGTMLQVAGLTAGESPEDWNITRPEEILAVQKAYFAAGSDIVCCNTFGANALKYHGRFSVEETVSAAVRIAREAAGGDRSKKIALDIGPTGRLLKPAGDLSFDVAYDAFARQVPLKSGGYLVIDETEALISVDVNTGHYKGKGSQEDAILEVNLEAVEEVARQLRLRNIGGLVVLDLIDMKSRKHQNQVYKALKTALKRDRARTNVLQISELGLLEMSRQRQDQSILSMLTSKCPYCNGRGVVKSPMAISIELQRHLTTLLRKSVKENRPFEPKIVIAPQVMQRLRTEDSGILAALQKDFNTRLTFVSELHRHPEAFSILDAATSQVLYSQS
jgi:hypothetical protein